MWLEIFEILPHKTRETVELLKHNALPIKEGVLLSLAAPIAIVRIIFKTVIPKRCYKNYIVAKRHYCIFVTAVIFVKQVASRLLQGVLKSR